MMSRSRRRKQLERYREALAEFGELHCGICLQPIISSQDLTVDHIYPKSLGGLSRQYNMQPAHAKCNTQKGHQIIALPPYRLSAYTVKDARKIYD